MLPFWLMGVFGNFATTAHEAGKLGECSIRSSFNLCHQVDCVDVLYSVTLRVQVPNNHILAQKLYYNYYYPNPKYPNIGYMYP